MFRYKQTGLLLSLALVMVLEPALNNRQCAYAAFGPCVQTPGTPSFLNSIKCQAGACVGNVQIVPLQSTCANTNPEQPCTNGANALLITYQPVLTDQGWATFLVCLANWGTVACCACAAAAAVVCLVPPWWPCVIGAGGCGAVCAGAGALVNPCCWTTCTQDLTTKFTVPGGSLCS